METDRQTDREGDREKGGHTHTHTHTHTSYSNDHRIPLHKILPSKLDFKQRLEDKIWKVSAVHVLTLVVQWALCGCVWCVCAGVRARWDQYDSPSSQGVASPRKDLRRGMLSVEPPGSGSADCRSNWSDSTGTGCLFPISGMLSAQNRSSLTISLH